MNNDNKLLDSAGEILSAIKYLESIDADAVCKRDLQTVRSSARKLRTDRFIRIAACLSLPFAIASGVLAWMLLFPKESERYAEVTSPVGAVVRYELPDNSTVWLNSGSRLSYPLDFSRGSRQVRLDGEAYFKVEPDSERPFYVNTSDNYRVRVCGTEFVVSAYPDDPEFTTTLESGVVQIEFGAGAEMQSVTMEPGEQTIFTKTTGTMGKHRVNTYEFTAWKDGTMVFRNATLEKIFSSLERKYGVSIQVRGKLSDDERYRATFRNESLDRILNYLSHIAGFSWHSEDDNRIEVIL